MASNSISIDYRLLFLSKYGDRGFPNLEALSHCYDNHKTLGVIYNPTIMDKIFQFDEEFSVKDNKVKIIIEETKPEIKVEQVFYRPPKFHSSQSKVGFKFINFVKSSNEDNITPLVKVTNEVNEIIHESVIAESTTTISNNEKELLRFKNALANSAYKEDLTTFKGLYLGVVDVNRLSKNYLQQSVPPQSKSVIHFKYTFIKLPTEHTCEIIFNNEVLLGRGSGHYKKKATHNALLDFHKECMTTIEADQIINGSVVDVACFPPEITLDNELDEVPEGAVMFDLPFLNKFYIRHNRNNFATSVLLEAFQYFRMTMQFTEIPGEVHLMVNNYLLASMPFCESLTNTKLLLSNFVLKNFEKSKWTLIRNTTYMNQFDDSVEKGGMYDKNLTDHTKIKSDTNIGGQLMMKMGWNEDSGLGKSGSGIKDPIINDSNGKRQGLGFNFGSSKDLKSFTNNVSKYLRDWFNEDGDDMIFDRDFDNKERAMIHKECRKLGVVSKSYNNTNGDRYLVVSKPRDVQEMFDWVQSKGGKTRLYTLLPPH